MVATTDAYSDLIPQMQTEAADAFNDVLLLAEDRTHKTESVRFARYDGLARQWEVRRLPVAPRKTDDVG